LLVKGEINAEQIASGDGVGGGRVACCRVRQFVAGLGRHKRRVFEPRLLRLGFEDLSV
jgi:hypothetical protein